MKILLFCLLVLSTSYTLSCDIPRFGYFLSIETIVPVFDPSNVQFPDNPKVKSLLKQMIETDNPQESKNRLNELKQHLTESDMQCLERFDTLKNHLETCPRRQWDSNQINQFIGTYKLNLRTFKHFTSVDLLLEFDSIIFTRHSV